MLGLGLSLWNSARGGGGGLVNPIRTNIVAWFKSGLGITSANGIISQWDDASGLAHHLPQASATSRPALQGDLSLMFDGVDNFMKAAPFTLAQPTTVYMVCKQKSWTSSDRLCDGNTTNTGVFMQTSSTPRIGASAGTVISSVDTVLTLDTYGVLCAVFNGVSSRFRVNGATAVASNAGAGNMGGFTLGASATPANYGHLQVKEIIIYNVAHDVDTETQVRAYLTAVAQHESLHAPLVLDETTWNGNSLQASDGKVFQRVGASYVLTVSGFYKGATTAVEVQIVNAVGGATVVDWAALDSSLSGGVFSGTVTVPEGGMYRVKIRKTDTPAVVVTSASTIGVGDLILWIGQSNVQQMWGLDASTETSNAGVVRFAGGYGAGWYAVSTLEQADEPTSGPGSQGFGGDGSVHFANDINDVTGVPLGVIQLAISGTDIASWISGGSSWTTSLNSFARATAPAAYKICIFQQGCANIVAGTTKASYLTSLATMEAQVRTHSTDANMLFGLCPIGQSSAATEAQNDDIRQAILEYLDTNASGKTFLAYTLSDLHDVALSPHFTTAQRLIYARRGATGVLKALGLAAFGADGPKLNQATATYDDATGVITLPVTLDGGDALREVDAGTAGTGLTGFVATSNTGVETITATAFSGTNILLTVATGKSSMGVTYLYGEPDVTAPVYDNNLITGGALPGRPLQPSRGSITCAVI